MSRQPAPVASQRSHWYWNANGVSPFHVPVVFRSRNPGFGVPVTFGAIEREGAKCRSGSVGNVWLEKTVTDLTGFVAVTKKRIVLFRSASARTYVFVVAPGM